MSKGGPKSNDLDGVALNVDDVKFVRAALDVAAGLLRCSGDGLRNSHEYARGLLMPATVFHGAGAAAHCQRCGRYTTDLRALRPADDPTCPVCNCGEKHYWTGSFVPPTPESKWRLP